MAERSKYLRVLKSALKEIKNDIKNADKPDYTKILVPFRMMLHPFEAVGEVKYEKRGSLMLANILAVLFFISTILRNVAYGFIFRTETEENFNIFPLFVESLGILFMWVLSSWSLSTLMEGEGKLKEIWITLCYSLTPIIIFTIPAIIISNVTVLEESAILSIVETVMTGWTVILVILSTLVIHQFSLKKTIFMTVLTVFGMACIVFLIIMFFSLFQQLYIFLSSVVNELMLRT